MMWSNYEPQTEGEMNLIERLDRQPVVSFANSDNAVNVWGEVRGTRTFDIVVDSYEVPETDILILEMLGTGSSLGMGRSGAASVPADTTHRISYDPVPEYADEQTVLGALERAVDAWGDANPAVDFVIADDGDINIEWTKRLPGDGIGVHVTRNLDGEKWEKIIITMGSEDCNRDYQQYSQDFLTYVIAHELGHYLGLRHIRDSGHLMYAGGITSDADDIFNYNTHGYVVPAVDTGQHEFAIVGDLLDEAGSINDELDVLAERHAQMRNEQDTAEFRENKDRIDQLTQQRAGIDRMISCVDQRMSLDALLASLG